MPPIIKYAIKKDNVMMDMNGTKSTKKLAWAVLTKGSPTSTSEVVKVTGHEEADQTVRDNPGVYYKSGPFLLA
jgi:hypothetical protein|tara:strand:- start:224 stop:442 length:219 start_codon:yes stop_codon:yes gene_type:complete